MHFLDEIFQKAPTKSFCNCSKLSASRLKEIFLLLVLRRNQFNYHQKYFHFFIISLNRFIQTKLFKSTCFDDASLKVVLIRSCKITVPCVFLSELLSSLQLSKNTFDAFSCFLNNFKQIIFIFPGKHSEAS